MFEDGSTFGKFIIDRRIGAGTTGTVYKAHTPDNPAPLAIKVLAPELAKDSKIVTMFDEEAKVGLSMKHPNVVSAVDVGREHGRYFIVFEFVDGIPLAHLVKRGPLPEGQCLWILRQLAQALRHLRQKKIVHQDIKPDNILIESHGNAKLTDLGFARVAQGKMKWEGFAVGTPVYMSPEQAKGLRDVDGRADIYSLGATIYHSSVGQAPFDGKTEQELLTKHINMKPEPARNRNPKLNADFSAILMRMLEKDPGKRFQHPEELLLSIRMLEITAVPPFVAGTKPAAG